ncbi:hypothetical protein JCM11251_000448 [Rhodosporidiobolus azoricus]
MTASHPNPDPSFHHKPHGDNVTTSSTTSNVETVPASTTAAHAVEPTPSRSAPSGAVDSATPASTTSTADPSVANPDAKEKKAGVEGAPAAEVSDAGVSGPEGGAGEQPEGGYPPQAHAGKLGLGPSYNQGGGLADTLAAKGEILKGKITHNPALVQQGHDRQSGVLQQQYQAEKQAEEEADSPFTRPDDGATEGNPQPNAGLGEKGTTAKDVAESGHAASASAGTASTKQE